MISDSQVRKTEKGPTVPTTTPTKTRREVRPLSSRSPKKCGSHAEIVSTNLTVNVTNRWSVNSTFQIQRFGRPCKRPPWSHAPQYIVSTGTSPGQRRCWSVRSTEQRRAGSYHSSNCLPPSRARERTPLSQLGCGWAELVSHQAVKATSNSLRCTAWLIACVLRATPLIQKRKLPSVSKLASS